MIFEHVLDLYLRSPKKLSYHRNSPQRQIPLHYQCHEKYQQQGVLRIAQNARRRRIGVDGEEECRHACV